MDFSNAQVSYGKHGVSFMTVTQFQTWFGVHPDHVGFVIGSKGATIKKISRDCKCFIKIQDPNKFSGGFPWFLIKGSTEANVCEAMHRLRTIANEADRRLPRMANMMPSQSFSQAPSSAPSQEKQFKLAPVPKRKHFKVRVAKSQVQNAANYIPKSQDYTPNSSNYAPKSLDYAPRSPDYAPRSSDYGQSKSPSPDYCPNTPEYCSDSPNYGPPKSPDFSPHSPTNPPAVHEEFEAAPEGWAGPFVGTYLKKGPEGFGAGKRFSSFEDAVEQANELGDKCKGITLTKTGYSLRKGELYKGELLIDSDGDDSHNGLASWHKV